MNLPKLSLAYLRAQPLSTLLNVLLLALGIATITVLLLLSQQLEDRLRRDAAGVDLVVGAKGSPIQLILSSLYQLDVPTGNIPLADARWLKAHPLVANTVPLALGDSFAGYRIIGTEPAYVDLYKGRLAAGRLWQAPLEAVLGADVAHRTRLGVGGSFVGSHGLTGGEVHAGAPYQVVGVLTPTGTVLDRSVLVSVESVWHVHEEPHEEHEEEAAHAEDDNDHAEDGHGHDHADAAHDHADEARERAYEEAERELTAVLVQYRSPMAAALLPRLINSRDRLQAAAPAYETARLFSLLGVGVNTLRAFGWILVLAAGLGIFIALYNALKERRYDLAILRTLGASRGALFRQLLLEGTALTLVGALLGLLLGHAAAEILGRAFQTSRQLELTGAVWVPAEGWLILLALCVGALAALLPAIQAYRTDISAVLSRR